MNMHIDVRAWGMLHHKPQQQKPERVKTEILKKCQTEVAKYYLKVKTITTKAAYRLVEIRHEIL